MTDYFDTSPEVEEIHVPRDGDVSTYVRVNGADIMVEAGSDFGETITQVAKDANFGKFRCYLDGNEITPDNAPSVIAEGSKMEIRPYDIAG